MKEQYKVTYLLYDTAGHRRCYFSTLREAKQFVADSNVLWCEIERGTVDAHAREYCHNSEPTPNVIPNIADEV